jgi:Flp pilus assembly protein TadG
MMSNPKSIEKNKRRSSRGTNVIHFLGLMMLTLMLSALGIDFGFYYAAQNQLQTTADAAALAGVTELFHSISVDPADRRDDARVEAQSVAEENLPNVVLDNNDVFFGYIDPATKRYNQANFRTPSNNANLAYTGGYNAVWVRVRKGQNSTNGPINTIMANLFGVHTFDTEATSVALLDQTVNAITDGGLRPIYVCQGQLTAAMQDGIPSNDTIRIYGNRVSVNGNTAITDCPAPDSGNWGFADLRDNASGAPGNNTLSDWWENGYDGTVTVGNNYSTQPGNAISSNGVTNAIDNLISNRSVITVPLYDTFTGNGSNTQVHISGFVGFQITDYDSHASASDRYIEGHFVRQICSDTCTSGTNGNTGPGSAVVKIRLASRS